MKKQTLITATTIVLFFLSNLILAQEVMLNGRYLQLESNLESYIAESSKVNDAIDGKYYRLIQLDEMPSKQMFKTISNYGIELIQYIPDYAYIIAVPANFNAKNFRTLNINHIRALDIHLKANDDLYQSKYPEYAVQGDKIMVNIKYYKNLDQTKVLEYCDQNNIEVLESNGYNSFLVGYINKKEIDQIASLPFLEYMQLVQEQGVPEDTPGRALHRANLINSKIPGGRKYNGENVGVLVRDDGFVGPHIDYQGRLTQDISYDQGLQTHGDGVGGIMTGAGNLDPRMEGMASGSFAHAINYAASFLDNTMNLFFGQNISITNSSYSNGCNAGYTNITATVDQQVFDNPTLMHVFSAGNSNNNDCGYGAGNQWGNITGGHKQGKNVIATANLFNNLELVESSSRGPAHDGRIKPDIAAHGQGHISTFPNNDYFAFGGTSGAAPGIAGCMAMLQNAYVVNHGEQGSTALLKAMMLNTANDMGNKGPDFKHGWGHINAYRAAMMIEENRFLEGTMEAFGSNQHTIDVPAGVKALKVMTYWPDPEASIGTSQSLINDIDSYITDPSGDITMPWVLDHRPDPASLDLPATKGEDHLNNMEQVYIDDPVAGTYTLNLDSYLTPFSSHQYFVVWEFRYDEITVAYPAGGESMNIGESEMIYWDAEEGDIPFLISYSQDAGQTWSNIGSAGANTRVYQWGVPNVVTGSALVRVTRDGQEGISQDTFSIAPVPNNPKFEWVCPDELKITWDSVPNATQYDVFALGDKFMDYQGSTDSTAYIMSAPDPFIKRWVAVAAKFPNGAKSLRTVAIETQGEGLQNCTLERNMSMLNIIEPEENSGFRCDDNFVSPVTIEVQNTGTEVWDSIVVGYSTNEGVEFEETVIQQLGLGDTYVHSFTQDVTIQSQGTFDLKAYCLVPGDEARFDDTLFIDFQVLFNLGSKKTIQENFENIQSDRLPSAWRLINPDGSNAWRLVTVNGADGFFGQSLYMPMYNYPDEDQTDAISMEPLDLSDNTGSNFLSFDLAYSLFSGFRRDTLMVLASTDCGVSFTDTLYSKSRFELSTVDDRLNYQPFSPNEWRREYVDISQFNGMRNVIFQFVAANDGGNNLYLDNINIESIVQEQPVANFTIEYDNACENELIGVFDNSTGGALTYEWTLGQGSSFDESNSQGPLFTQYIGPGLKTISLTVTNELGSDTHTESFEINRSPIGQFNIMKISDLEIRFIATTLYDNDEFFWDFGDGFTSTDKEPTHTYASGGSYLVNFVVPNECGELIINKLVTLTSTATEDEIITGIINLFPNPTNDFINIEIDDPAGDKFDIDIYDVEGRKITSVSQKGANGKCNVQLDLHHIEAGLLLAKINNGKQTTTVRFVKN